LKPSLKLFLILKNSPAINTYYNLSWDHNIQYSLRTPTNDNVFFRSHVVTESEMEEIFDKVADHKQIHTMPEQKNLYTIHFINDIDIEFLVFHKKTLVVIQA
jgi:hypothetical protein